VPCRKENAHRFPVLTASTLGLSALVTATRLFTMGRSTRCAAIPARVASGGSAFPR
jgi:hypothetical protein